MNATALTQPEMVAIDTELADLWLAYWKVADRTSAYDTTIRDARKCIRGGLTAARGYHYEERLAAAEAKVAEIMAEAKPLADIARTFDKAHYTGWTRFWTVADGHVHLPHCHTLYPTTRIGWTPSLSGLTEADAVALLGPTLCTHCFPSAPVEWTRGIDKGYCDGAGKYVQPEAGRSYRKYATCPDCGKSVARTGTGVLRAHKPEAK